MHVVDGETLPEFVFVADENSMRTIQIERESLQIQKDEFERKLSETRKFIADSAQKVFT